MEPVTHVLTGACLARAGFNRRAAYATLTMAIAAELPDVDVLWKVRGPVESFAHHRGITHTFLGLPFEAAILVAAVYGLHRWRLSRSLSPDSVPSPFTKPLTAVPVRWGWLYLCAVVALLSHLLLDYTNNYGIRPFYPFNGHWYAASIVFIFDPIIFALLLLALVVPPLFGLINAEVGGKRQRFRGRGMAIGALVCIVAMWVFRYVQHSRAEEIAFSQTYEQQPQPVAMPDAGVAKVPPPASSAADSSADKGDAPTDARDDASTPDTELVQPPGKLLQVQRVTASPDPVNPFQWSVAMDYGALYQLATVDVRSGAISPDQVTYPKPTPDAVLRAAEASPMGRIYLDWSPMPILTEEEPVVASRPGAKPVSRVLFRDPRFMGDVSWLRLSGDSPLTAVVTVDDNGRVVRQAMDGQPEPAGRGAIADIHWGFGAASTERASASHHAPPHPAKTPANQPVLTASQPARPPLTATRPAPPPPAPTPAPSAPPAVPKAAAPLPQPVEPKPLPPPPPTPPPVPQPTVAVTPTVAPPPAPPEPAPAPVAKHVVVMTPRPIPEKTEPSAFGRAYDGAAARLHRFQSWLHWLTHPQ